MVDLKNISRVYFIGIGGIGMSALARYFSSRGVTVSGYDKTETNLSKQLEEEGINIHYTDDINLLDRDAEWVVYTPAVPKEHREFSYYQKNNYTLLKRSDVLGKITEDSFNICIAGTHGKTTISAMIAHILRDSGYGCNAFLGGVSVNYNTNFWSQAPAEVSEGSKKNVCVVEADEFDRSFLKLKPDVAIISAMDADHLDIYGTEEVMQNAFIEFSGKIRSNGLLLSKYGLKKDKELTAPVHVRYSLQNDAADIYAYNITMSHGSYSFDVMTSDWTLDNVILNMGGMHNVENVVAAITVAHHLKIEPNKIKTAVENFKGVKRRFEYIIKTDKEIFIDDYAHHPEELKALITGARTLFPGMRCTVVFQPHLFSRTRDFAKEFATILDMADDVILLPIYPARELPIEGVTSELILNEMKMAKASIQTKEELINYLNAPENPLSTCGEGRGEGCLFITAGAGDIDTLIEPIKQMILNNKNILL
ncbi:MAG TPA: UDP-N-acetylmuramate--L-alanine ligase [Chitinophagaceae bacterium]|nr:UDP-N-acetylmuramate--L-alanine ligase [Chitinophagaceae bacterium]